MITSSWGDLAREEESQPVIQVHDRVNAGGPEREGGHDPAEDEAQRHRQHDARDKDRELP
jgi:hypothetical protein